MQAPGVEVTVETAAGADGEKGRFKMPSVKLPKVKAPHVQVSLPKAEGSAPKAQAEVQEGEVALQAPDVEGGLEVAAGKVEGSGGGMKLHMPKVKVPSVVFSKPTVKAPKLDADVSLPKVDASLPEADLKAGAGDISITAPDVKLPSVEGSLELQAPETDLKAASAEASLDGAKLEATGLKGKLKMPKFDKPKFGVSLPKAEGPEGEGSLPTVEVDLPSATVTAAGEGPALGLKADVPGAKTDGDGWKLEKPSLKMPKADIKAPKVDISLPSVDVSLPKASVDLQAPEATLSLEGEAKTPEKEPGKTKDGKFKMPKFGMPSFGWSSSREAKGSAAADADVSLKEPQLTVASGSAEVDVTLPGAEIHSPAFEFAVHSSTEKDCDITKDAGILKDHDSLEHETLKLGGKTSITETCVSDSEVTVKIPKFRKPKFGFSWSKGKQSESDVVCQVEREVSEGKVTSDMTYKRTQVSDAEFDVTIQKPSPEVFSDAPKLDVSVSSMEVVMPKLEVGGHYPECKAEQEVVSGEMHTEEKENKFKTSKFKLPSLSWSPKKAAIALSEAEVHIEEPIVSTLSGYREAELTSAEKISSEIPLGDVEIKSEGPEGKTKMSKFQMPKFGITHIKGKGSEKEVRQSKSEVMFPQLKAMVDIADIAVDAPNLEVECGARAETDNLKVKMTKADEKAPEPDVHVPSADISILKPDSDIQDSDASLKIKGEAKQDGDGEEKEGHFKMPKFKLPSFSWSPKKESSVKPDSGATLEDHKLAIMSSTADIEVKGAATDDKGAGPSLDLEVSAGKVEQKSPIKKPQFAMPKISLSKIKVPKSQSYSPKVEADATTPKTEKENVDSIQIPDIERSHSVRTEEGAQISIKLADVKIPSLEFSKIETGAPQNEMGVSSAQIDAAQPPSEASFQQVVVLKSSSTNEDTIQKPGMKLPKGEAVGALRSPEIVTESSLVVDGRKNKLEGPEGKIKMPKFQKPKFGISLTKGKGSETEIRSPKPEAEFPQMKMTNEVANITVGVPASELTSDVSDSGVGTCKIKAPQFLTAGIEASEVDVSSQSVSKPVTEGVIESLEEKEIVVKEEHEIKAEEFQTEEHQGWFKMPKFRIPAFGRTSSKEKKSDVDIERSTVKAQLGIPSAKVQTETSIPEKTLPRTVAEITIEKQEIPKSDSAKSSDVSSSVVKGGISVSTERTDIVNIAKPETYAEVVKHDAEGQKMHTSEFTVSSAELSKSYLSASEIHKDDSLTNRFPLCTLTLQEHKAKSQYTEIPKIECSTKSETSGIGCKLSSGEITLDATEDKIDSSLPKGKLDVQEAIIRKGKVKGEMKIIAEDSEGRQLKRPASEWSTMKGSEDDGFVTAKMEVVKVEVSGVKMDVKMARVDPEKKFQVKSVERDTSARVGVQVEDKAESKIKTHKFKIPTFGVLHSEVKDLEDDTNLQNLEAVSVSKTQIGTAETQFQKSEGSIILKSPSLDHMEASARTTVETLDKSQDGPDVNINIPKLKIPKFTFKALPIEADISMSKVVTDPKGSSADIEVVKLQATSAIPEETPEVLEGGIQKAKSKILTLTEPDIKTAQVTTNARQDIHWSYVEGQEISEKVEPEHVAIERCEIYTTEILKESEVLSSEVKTATLGFSLIKAKLPESHSNSEVLVQQPSPTEDLTVSKPICADENFRVAAQTSSAEPKLSDKPHTEAKEFSGEVSLPKLKKFDVEVKLSSKVEESLPKAPEGVTASPFSKGEDVAEALDDEEKDIIDEKEKTDSKRSPGRFKFWLPNLGFSSPSDETSVNSKTVVKKSVPEDVRPADMPDNDSSKPAEKTGWFRFPKLGFSSPTKKVKTADREQVDHKEGRISDEDSPSDKPDVFFDAQESLSPKEITESKSIETDEASSRVPVSRTIVTSSARTELILLEEEKDSQSNIPGLPAK